MRRLLPILTLLAASTLGACGEPTTTVSRCVPEGKCEELLHSTKAVFTSVGGDVQAGRALFMEKCVKCHGEGGQGAPGGASLDLANAGWQKGRTDNQIRLTVLRGRGTMMPPFPLDEKQQKDVVAFVRSLKAEAAPVEKGY
jgi:mono/diheme cytochrome c family protein